MYKNYIFDLYGTLVDIRTDEKNPCLWEKMSEIYGANGAIYTPRALHRAFRRLEREEMARMPLQNAEINLTNVFVALYCEKGVECSASLATMTAMVFRALSRSRLQLYDGVLELLDELKKRKKGIYLLSNAQADFTRPELSMLGLDKYFDGIFLSSEQGVKKPSKEFFERLLKTYRLSVEESVMIGNDEADDIAGAASVGMDSLYIHTDISPRRTGKFTAAYCVPDGDFRKIKDLILNGG